MKTFSPKTPNAAVPPGKPRILALTSSYPSNDRDPAGRFVAEWAASLAPFAEVTVLAPAGASGGTTVRNGVRVERFTHWPRPPLLAADADLRRILATRPAAWLELPTFHGAFFHRARRLAADADIVCSHWLLPTALVGGLVARRAGLPHVAIEHSGGVHLLTRLPFGKWLLRLILKRTHGIAVVSADLGQKLRGFFPQGAVENLHVLPMGVDAGPAGEIREFSRETLKKRLGLSPHERLFVFLGRLVEIKGGPTVLSALAGCGGVTLAVVGDGPCRAEWEALAGRLGVRAVFPGPVHGRVKWEWLGAADALVVPSRIEPDGRTEGAPVVVLEALAAGTPVIASHVGGVPELVRDGETGRLLPPDDIVRWRACLTALIADPSPLRSMADRLRAEPIRHAWAERGAAYAGWLREVALDFVKKKGDGGTREAGDRSAPIPE